MRSTSLTRILAILVLSSGCQAPRSRPPSDVAAIRKPTLWDHLLSDRQDEREAIASRLKAEKSALRGRKASLMRTLRENELEAQLSASESERLSREKTVAELSRQVNANEGDLEWVASKQKQNSHDWRYWPDHDEYRKPAASAVAPVVETPTRNDFVPTASR